MSSDLTRYPSLDRFIQEIELSMGPGKQCQLHTFLTYYINELFLNQVRTETNKEIETVTKVADPLKILASADTMKNLGVQRPLVQVALQISIPFPRFLYFPPLFLFVKSLLVCIQSIKSLACDHESYQIWTLNVYEKKLALKKLFFFLGCTARSISIWTAKCFFLLSFFFFVMLSRFTNTMDLEQRRG